MIFRVWIYNLNNRGILIYSNEKQIIYGRGIIDTSKIFLGGDSTTGSVYTEYKSIRLYDDLIIQDSIIHNCASVICENGVMPDKCSSCPENWFLNEVSQGKSLGTCVTKCRNEFIEETTPYIASNTVFDFFKF